MQAQTRSVNNSEYNVGICSGFGDSGTYERGFAGEISAGQTAEWPFFQGLIQRVGG